MKRLFCLATLLITILPFTALSQKKPAQVRYFVPSFDYLDGWRDPSFGLRLVEVLLDNKSRPVLTKGDGCTFRLEAVKEDAEITAVCEIKLKTVPQRYKLLYPGHLLGYRLEDNIWEVKWDPGFPVR